MCGIIGYIGSKPVVPVLLDGLRRMEYRGYDSAGVALVSPEGIELRRSAGKLINLENAIRTEPIDGVYGVGHTRWATHGRPTEENAHPHRDCTGKIVVVHNGIIENYLELKHELQAQGHVFKTETDTEIVAHLVEREMRSDGLENAVRRALDADARHVRPRARVGGRSREDRRGPQRPADRRRPRRQRVLRRLRHPGHPVAHPRRRVPRRRGDGGHHAVGRAVHRLQRPRGVEDHAARAVGSDRGGEGRLQALHAQGDLRAADAPRATPSWAACRSTAARSSSRICTSRRRRSQSLRKVTILACGTSWHAGLVGKYMIEALAQVPVEVDYGSEYRYRNPIVAPQRARHRHHPVRRDRRHAGGAARGRAEGRQQHRHLQRGRQRGRRATPTAPSTRTPAPRSAWPPPRRSRRSWWRCSCWRLYLAQVRGTLTPDEIRGHIDELLHLPQIDRAGDQGVGRRSRRSPSGSTAAPTSCSWAAASTIRSRSRAR